jgi:DNA-binding NarL/FixJ family response regulator
MLAHQRPLRTMVAAFRLGANAYLAKVATCDTFIKSLELVMLGVTLLPSEILNFICHRQDRSRAAGPSGHAAHHINAPDDGNADKDDDDGEMIGTRGETNQLSPRAMTSLTPLSIQQQSILRCLIQGDSNKGIARKLAISEATAKVHVKAILRKIRVHNRTQAAIWAMSTAPVISEKDDISSEEVTEAAAAAPAGNATLSASLRTDSEQYPAPSAATECVIRRSHDRDEDLGGAHLPGEPVEHRHSIAGEVYEQLLAGRVGLPHGRRDPVAPFDVEVAEPAVAVAVGMMAAVFLPQQRQRYAAAAQLGMDMPPIRKRLRSRRVVAGRRK